jgi:hypothetical protein
MSDGVNRAGVHSAVHGGVHRPSTSTFCVSWVSGADLPRTATSKSGSAAFVQVGTLLEVCRHLAGHGRTRKDTRTASQNRSFVVRPATSKPPGGPVPRSGRGTAHSSSIDSSTTRRVRARIPKGSRSVGFGADDHAMLEARVRHGRRHQIDEFLAQGDRCGWCRCPIRLRGFVVSGRPGEQTVTFSSGSLPEGVVLMACGSRSEIRCPSCAAIYRGDSRHLVRAGLEGGKGVDEAIALHPAVFLTLTAPGFGAVHTASGTSPCHAGGVPALCVHRRPEACSAAHGRHGELVGTPLCTDCYDDVGAVLQTASTPELWRRTMIYARRQLAAVLGCTQADTGRMAGLSFCRVAEFQRRGIVHLHAVVRATVRTVRFHRSTLDSSRSPACRPPRPSPSSIRRDPRCRANP